MRRILFIGFFTLFPALAFADDGFKNFKELVLWAAGLVNLAIPVAGGIALLVFLWGLVKFISKSGDAKNNAEGKSLMIWGIIALFVMISYMGIIKIFQQTAGLPQKTTLPYIPVKK